MFCFQCQETVRNVACTVRGVCGKTEDVSNLQDLLIFVSKGVSYFAHIAHQQNIPCDFADTFMFEALFMTITNANFNDSIIIEKIKEGQKVREQIKNILETHTVNIPESLPKEATLTSTTDE
ncbi:MAG TPA: hydroxylamine reductase, partial [Bacteroidales bacterium]|nr:hydroxylamine reductase [Bacteroidales bacterium]